jgi:hypothetical protein
MGEEPSIEPLVPLEWNFESPRQLPQNLGQRRIEIRLTHNDVRGNLQPHRDEIPDSLDSTLDYFVAHQLRRFRGRRDDSQVDAHPLRQIGKLFEGSTLCRKSIRRSCGGSASKAARTCSPKFENRSLPQQRTQGVSRSRTVRDPSKYGNTLSGNREIPRLPVDVGWYNGWIFGEDR